MLPAIVGDEDSFGKLHLSSFIDTYQEERSVMKVSLLKLWPCSLLALQNPSLQFFLSSSACFSWKFLRCTTAIVMVANAALHDKPSSTTCVTEVVAFALSDPIFGFLGWPLTVIY